VKGAPSLRKKEENTHERNEKKSLTRKCGERKKERICRNLILPKWGLKGRRKEKRGFLERRGGRRGNTPSLPKEEGGMGKRREKARSLEENGHILP